MSDAFDWVPFFKEMAKRLLAFRTKQSELIDILKRAGVAKGLTDEKPKGKKIPLEQIDPFSFTALIIKHSNTAKRIQLLKLIKKELNLKSAVPTGFSGMPNVYAPQAWLFAFKYNRQPSDITNLWDLFEEVVRTEKISEAAFAAAKSVRSAGKAKLTQAIFRASPHKFLPIDGQTKGYLTRLGYSDNIDSAASYLEICRSVQQNTKRAPYLHSYDAWLSNKYLQTEADYQQAVLKKATSKSKPRFKEPAGGLPVPEQRLGRLSFSYPRSTDVASMAIRRANFLCEMNGSHKTFLSSSKSKPYVEAHHLIPLCNQKAFKFSLDVLSNVVALCPTCHRLLHHGLAEDKKTHLKKMFGKRKLELNEKEIILSDAGLLRYYSKDFSDEIHA